MTQSVDVRNVSVRYQTPAGAVTALDDVSFRAASSEFLCIVGPSGCGKTTIINCLAGFVPPTSGEILIGGKSVTAGEFDSFDRGVVFQDLTQLFPWRTARRNIEYGLEVRKMSVSKRRERSQELLDLIGLDAFADAYPHQLSGGMQQRVAIARALAYEPDILLMDEPFAALDAMTRENMQYQLAEIWAATRTTIIYITHNVAEAVYLGDIIVIMGDKGTVKAVVRNDLPRPRDFLSDRFVQMQRGILDVLRDRAATPRRQLRVSNGR